MLMSMSASSIAFLFIVSAVISILSASNVPNPLFSNAVFVSLITFNSESKTLFTIIVVISITLNNPLQNIDWSSNEADSLIKKIQQDVLIVFE